MDKNVIKAKNLCKKIHAKAVYVLFDEEKPYYEHCYAVVEIIKKYVKENINFEYAYKLAYLHDSIEDTDVTYDYLLENFGKDVADGVFALTKNKDIPYENQIEESIGKIKKLGKREVAITKMADRACNLLKIPDFWSLEKAEHYLQDAILIYDNLKFASLSLSEFLNLKIEKYKVYINDKLNKWKLLKKSNFLFFLVVNFSNMHFYCF